MSLPRSLRIGLPIAFVVAAAVLLGVRLRDASAPRPDPKRAAPTYPDFTVDTASGALALSDLRPQVVVVYFGYTSCPDICPTTLATVGSAVRKLPSELAARTTAFFVSVDPARDKVAHIAEYVRFFHPRFVGGTAPPERLEAIARSWGVYYALEEDPGSALGYTVDHSTQAFLVSPAGEVLAHLPHGATADEIAASLREAHRSSARLTPGRSAGAHPEK